MRKQLPTRRSSARLSFQQYGYACVKGTSPLPIGCRLVLEDVPGGVISLSMHNRHTLRIQDGGSSGYKPLHVNHKVADEQPPDGAPAEQVLYIGRKCTSACHESAS